MTTLDKSTPARVRTGSFTVRSGVLLTVAVFFANVSNYLFQVSVGRFLGPEEYGLLSSIFTMIAIVGVGASSLQAACAKAEASRRGDVVLGPRQGPLVALRDPLVRFVFLVALGVGALLLAGAPFLGRFFHSAAAPLVMFAALVPSMALLSITFGRLQGMERFLPFAVLSLGLAAGKLVLGSGVVIAGLGVTSVIGVLTVVSLVGAVAGLAMTSDAPPLAGHEILGDIARALIALTLFWTLVGIDVPFARHWLPHDEAGQYAAASVIGKGILWLPDIVALVVFPELAASLRDGRSVQPLLRRAAALVVGACLAGCLALWVAGDFAFRHVFGGEYTDAGSLAWKLGLVSTPLALANLFIFVHLAGRGWRWLVGIVAVVGVQVAGFTMFHGDTTQFVTVTGVAASTLAIVLGFSALRTRPDETLVL